jgi:NitT/TauT family transport system substrate-binding protein/taurine transport system substrate-binding protein
MHSTSFALSRQKWQPGIFLSLLLAILLAACGSAGTAGSGGSKPTVVIGYMDNGAEPELIAIAQKLFEKDLNANIQIKYFDSGPASLSAIAAGSVQIMTGIGSPPVVSAITTGVDLQAVWAQELYTQDEGLVVRSGSGINSVKDLAGKTVALVLGSTSEYALNATLIKNGVDPKSVHKLNMAPPAIRTAWLNHSVDAAYVWDPVFDALRQNGGNILSTDEDVAQEAPVYSLSVVNTSWAKNNAALVKGFIQAQDEAVQYYKQHTQDALTLMAKQDSIDLSVATTEMAGYKVFDAQDQLGADALGQGNTIGSSLVAKSFVFSAKFKYSIGTLSTLPNTDFSANVSPTYVEQYLASKK